MYSTKNVFIDFYKTRITLNNCFSLMTSLPKVNPKDGTRVILLRLMNKNFEDLDMTECAKFGTFVSNIIKHILIMHAERGPCPTVGYCRLNRDLAYAKYYLTFEGRVPVNKQNKRITSQTTINICLAYLSFSGIEPKTTIAPAYFCHHQKRIFIHDVVHHLSTYTANKEISFISKPSINAPARGSKYRLRLLTVERSRDNPANSQLQLYIAIYSLQYFIKAYYYNFNNIYIIITIRYLSFLCRLYTIFLNVLINGNKT